MKMQKSAIFVEKRLKINMLMIKNIVKMEIIVIIEVSNFSPLIKIYQFYYKRASRRIQKTTYLLRRKY